MKFFLIISLIILILLICLSLIYFLNIHSFLACNAPIKADILVVEGWLTDIALEGALKEFKTGNYQLLITTGQTLKKGSYLLKYKTFAQLAEATLLALGMERDKLIAVPCVKMKKDRTFTSAQTLSEWLLQSNLNIKTINLYSEDVHTRRSWILFKKVFEPDIKVGVISFHSIEYDVKKWWISSEGIRTVIPETISYIYAKIFTIFN